MYILIRRIKKKGCEDTAQYCDISKEQAKILLKGVNKTLRNLGLNPIVVNCEEVNGNTAIDYIMKIA